MRTESEVDAVILPHFPHSWSTAALALALALGGAGSAQEAPPAKDASEPPPARDKELARSRNSERWEKMSRQEQEKLREIYRRLQTLPPARRQELLETLRKMAPSERKQAIAQARERVRQRMGEGDLPEASRKAGKKRIRTAPVSAPSRPPVIRADQKPSGPPKQEIQRRLRKAVERWTEQLPPEVRDRVRAFTRKEQLDLFRSFRETEILMRAFPESAERDSLLALAPKDLRGISRPDATIPSGISPESWARWLGLIPREKQIVLRRLEMLREDRGAAAPALQEGRATGAPPSRTFPPEAQK